MIKSDFMKLYEELSVLHESKQDVLNFKRYIMAAGVNEAGADRWIQRFNKLKQILKAPQNDYYYWIKNKTVGELEDFIEDTEGEQEQKKVKKENIKAGSKLVNETSHWKIYHITNFEAAQSYGRDTQWCITGINNAGSRYWDEYIDDDFDFYFLIAKDNYSSRGWDSKFAFAIKHDEQYYQIFNQQDDQVELEDIPYYKEISIPGIDLLNSYYNELELEDDPPSNYSMWTYNLTGPSTKKEGQSIEHFGEINEVLWDIVRVIRSLTDEEKAHFSLSWVEYYDDEEGDIIVSVYSLEEETAARLAYSYGAYDEEASAIAEALGIDFATSFNYGVTTDPAESFSEEVAVDSAVEMVVDYIEQLSPADRENFYLKMTNLNDPKCTFEVISAQELKSADSNRIKNNNLDKGKWIENRLRRALGLKLL